MLLLLLLSQPLLPLKQEDSLLLLSAPHVLVRCAAPDLYELLLLLLNPLVMDLPGGILYHFPPPKNATGVWSHWFTMNLCDRKGNNRNRETPPSLLLGVSDWRVAI